MNFSVKYGIEKIGVKHTADTKNVIFIKSEFEVALITPGSVPRVFDEPVIKVSCFIMAISDNEHSMVDGVDVL